MRQIKVPHCSMLNLFVQIWFDWMSYFSSTFVDRFTPLVTKASSYFPEVQCRNVFHIGWMCVFWWEIVILGGNFDENSIDKLIVHAQHFCYKFEWTFSLELHSSALKYCVIVTGDCVRHVFVFFFSTDDQIHCCCCPFSNHNLYSVHCTQQTYYTDGAYCETFLEKCSLQCIRNGEYFDHLSSHSHRLLVGLKFTSQNSYQAKPLRYVYNVCVCDAV